ncbi:MAG: hypothetical protein ACHQ17_11040 [Polyangia bacterium]
MKKWAGLIAILVAGCGGNHQVTGDLGGGCTTIDGVCLTPAPLAAVRTACGDVTEYCDPAGKPAPNLACLATPPALKPGPAAATLTGFIHVFSSGPDSKNVSVAIYDAAPLLAGMDLSAVTPLATIASTTLDPATERACDADAKNGCSIPSTTGCTLPVCGDGLNGRPDNIKYCRANEDGTTSCNDRLRWEAHYSLPSIPTNKQLVIRASGQGGAADQTWANLVSWNVVLSTNDPACAGPSSTDCWDLTDPQNPKYQLDVNALSKSDYVNIPTSAGLSGGISEGQGAIAGEIHDCDNIRVGNVSVGETPAADRFSYFNGNPIMTLPDPSRLGTDQLGLYTALNIKPGKVHVVAGGSLTDGGPLTSFGSFDGYVYADTVSVINVNGGKPKP